MIIEMSVFEIKELMNQYVEVNLAKKRERVGDILDKFMSSGSYEMKEDFLRSFLLGIYVTDVSKAEIELKPIHIKKLSDPVLCLLLIEILSDKKFLNMQSVKDIKLKVYIDKYVKKEYEVRNYFNNLLVSFSNVDAGITLNQKLIEECLSAAEKKKYVKGVQVAVTTTLTGKNIDNSFRVHPETKERIVRIEDLRSYLAIGEKSRKVKCPVCSVENKITAKNLTEVIQVEDDVFVYKCTHSESSTNIGKEFFKKNVSCYFSKKYSAREKSMFVLNNFDRLVNDTL